MSAKLRVVGKEAGNIATASDVWVDALYYPRHFGARRNMNRGKHDRFLKKGEIIRFVQTCLGIFFEVTVGNNRHKVFKIREIKKMIGPEVEQWVRRLSHNADYKLSPSQIAQALRLMDVDGVRFRIEGNLVMLPENSSDNLSSSISLRRR